MLDINKDLREFIRLRYATIPIEIWNQNYVHKKSYVIFGRSYKLSEWYLLVSILFTEKPTLHNIGKIYGKRVSVKSHSLVKLFEYNMLDVIITETKKKHVILTKNGLDLINEIISLIKSTKQYNLLKKEHNKAIKQKTILKLL